MNRRKLQAIASKITGAMGALGELADALSDDDGGQQTVTGSNGFRATSGGAAAPRVTSQQTEIDEPEIGWRMGFIRMLDGRCPWCGEPMELVTCTEPAGITWKCPEACNP